MVFKFKNEVNLMNKPVRFLLWPVIFLFLIAGCSNQGNPLNSDNATVQNIGLPQLSIPSGADFVSAGMILNVAVRSDQSVTVHRITSGWIESEVTWAVFDGAYDLSPAASFVPASLGDIEIDVSSLVQSWLDGTYENHGIVLRQAISMSQYNSSEATDPALRPRLVIRYTTASGPDSAVIQDGVSGEVEDAFIGKNFANGNNGEATRLFVGIAFGFEHQTLIQFKMDIPQQELGALGDFVWNDLNKDGIQDVDEPGMPFITVNLYNDLDNLLATAYTDSNGYYLFDELAEGQYLLEFIHPAEYEFCPPNSGADDVSDSDVDPLTGQTGPIILTSGQTDLSWDAGMYMIEIIDNSDGCTHGLGYWKNHAGFGPQTDMVSALLPIWLGAQGGKKSIEVRTAQITVDILKMHTYGHPSNGITKLYAQLLAAKLNIANGANGTDIFDVIDEADAFLAENDWNDWEKLTREESKIILEWKEKLSDYNSGKIGPGNCDRVQDVDGEDDQGDIDILEAGR
jgi:hypothetical protein